MGKNFPSYSHGGLLKKQNGITSVEKRDSIGVMQHLYNISLCTHTSIEDTNFKTNGEQSVCPEKRKNPTSLPNSVL